MYAKKAIKLSILTSTFLLITRCATIVNNKPDTFNVTSDPSSAKVVITDVALNEVVLENYTPFDVTLNKKAGYFSGKTYSVKVSKEGYKDMVFNIKPTLSGWYIGNILFGGVLGMLIIDPLSGGMWNLVPEAKNNVTSKDQVIGIKLLSDLTEDEKQRMQKIN